MPVKTWLWQKQLLLNQLTCTIATQRNFIVTLFTAERAELLNTENSTTRSAINQWQIQWKRQHTQHAVQTRIHRATYNQQQRTWWDNEKMAAKTSYFYSVLTAAKHVLHHTLMIHRSNNCQKRQRGKSAITVWLLTWL